MRREFITWYFNEFRLDPMYEAMTNTVEDSPWHRERNVGVHVDMVVSQYLARVPADEPWFSFSKANGHRFLLGAFACAFHDVGKPESMQIKFSEERGEYRAFNGHEPVSARMWEMWALQNWDMLKSRFHMRAEDIYITGWMIENHLPWGLKKEDKLNNLATTVAVLELWNVFPVVLMADASGRISDDHDQKISKSNKWVDEFDPRVRNCGIEFLSRKAIDHRSDKMLIVPIAPSGAGKSTLYNGSYSTYECFSLDQERIRFAQTNLDTPLLDDKTFYSVAWGFCNDNKADFNKEWQANYVKMIKTGQNIFLDNTNLSKKGRRFFIDLAHKHGYKTKAVLMPIPIAECIARQESRGDKTVPTKSVIQQYAALQLPWYGEFDEVQVLL